MSERKHSKKQQAYAGCPLEGAQPNSPSAESRQVNQNLEDRIKQIQAEKIQLEEQCRQMETHNKQLEERHNGFVKNQQVLQVKLNEALHRNAEMVHENKQLDTKYRELEARNKDLEERHKESLMNQQKQPNVDNINEGWGIMFNQAKQRIASLMTEKKQNRHELRTMSCQLQQAQAVNLEIYAKLQDAVNLKQQLQVQLDEALEENQELLQEKKQQDIKEKDMECKLHNMKKQNDVLQVKINEALHRNAQVLHEKKQLDTKYRELEGRNKDLEERHKESLINQQKQPNVDNINEGWGIMFNQAKQRIVSLITEKKQNSYQLQQAQAVTQEIYGNLQHAVNLKQQLQVQLDEALEENQELLQEKKQQDIKEKEMECKLHNMKKQNDVLQVKINEALHRNAQVLHEKKQLDTKYRELEGRNKDLEERHKEMLVNQQKQPNVDNINEGWGIMFNQAKQRIASLMTEKKQNRHELRTMSCQLQQAQAVNLEIYAKLQDAVNLKQQLQVQLDEALEKNQELLQEKEQLEKIQEKKNTRTIRRTGERRDPPASSLDHEAA